MKDEMLRYTLRINPYIMAKFAYVAEYNGRTKNREIEQLIKRSVEDFEKQHGEIIVSHESRRLDLVALK